MTLQRRTLLMGAAATGIAVSSRARAKDMPLKIGVLTDLSGPYSDDAGPLSVLCARQAASEFTAATGIATEVVAGDHRLKPDIAASIAREWLDRDGVDAICDMSSSAVALAVDNICVERDKAALASAAATVDFMKAKCNPNTVQWAYDAYQIGTVVPRAVLKEGGDTWFLIGADYVGSQQMVQFSAATVKANGGRVLGQVLHPFPGTGDFSSYLLQAQTSGAKVLGLCNNSNDLINTLKQAQEFGLSKTMRIAVSLMFASNIHAVGLELAQNSLVSESFYWDLNDRTRAFTSRLKQRSPDLYHANSLQAASYGVVLQYLKAAASLGVAQAKASGAATITRMKQMPADDDCFGPGVIRSDGRKINDSFVFQVKTPAESREPWDILKLVSTIPGKDAVFPADPSCPLTPV